MKYRKLNMLTRWTGSKLECACSPDSPCEKYQKGKCEIEQLLYDPKQNIRDCIKHSSYKRVNGAFRQVRDG